MKRIGTALIILCFLLTMFIPYTEAQAMTTKPKIHIALSKQQVDVGETFEMAIWLQNFSQDYAGIEGFEIRIKYDPELIELVEDQSTFYLNAIFNSSSETVLNRLGDDGEIGLAQFVQPGNNTNLFSGYGKVGLITFKALKEGIAKFEQFKSIVIMPGNVGMNIKHDTSHPSVVIGKGVVQKVESKEVGQEPTVKPKMLSSQEVLQRFKDVSEISSISWAKDNIAELARLQIVNGTPEGYFYPNRLMTRAEFAKVVVLTLGLDMVQQQSPTFVDIKKTDWFYDYVETAAAYGLINGVIEDGERFFKPNNPITRAEISSILSKALTNVLGKAIHVASLEYPFSDVGSSHWAKDHILRLYQQQIIRGKSENTFAPEDHATRAEISAMLARFLQQE